MKLQLEGISSGVQEMHHLFHPFQDSNPLPATISVTSVIIFVTSTTNSVSSLEHLV